MEYKSILELIKVLEEDSKRHYVPLIDREDGAVLATLAYTAPPGIYLDLGAGLGYSTLWLAIGGSGRAEKIIAVEWDPDLIPRLEINAKRIEEATGVKIEVVQDDAVKFLMESGREISFALVFVDIEKWQYARVLQLLSNRMVKGGFASFHNAFFPRPPEEFFREASRYDNRIIPTPQGLMIIKF